MFRSAELRKTLASLPETLDETYARILANIAPKHRQRAIRILQFLTYSERPLTVEEAIDAIVVNPDGCPQFDPTWRMPIPKEIMRVCSSLVSLVSRQDFYETTMELQLAHFSVKEYLTSERVEETFRASMSEINARASITRVCLAYLSHCGNGECPNNKIKEEFPLAKYSAWYWMDHARHAETEKDVQESILDFFLTQRKAYAVWGYLFNPDSPLIGSLEPENMATPLYYASLAGLRDTAKLLLEKEANVNAQYPYGNALQTASYQGHEKVVQLLLEKGADVNAGGKYGNALQAASTEGCERVVQLLLDKGVKHNFYKNALKAASEKRHEKVVQLLLEKVARELGSKREKRWREQYATASAGERKKKS